MEASFRKVIGNYLVLNSTRPPHISKHVYFLMKPVFSIFDKRSTLNTNLWQFFSCFFILEFYF